MPLTRIAIIPAAPLLLAAASPTPPETLREALAALRDEVTTAVTSLPERGTALLLDAGPEVLVHDADAASLVGYGLPHVRADVTIDTELLAAVSARGQAPRVRSDHLDADPAVLALVLAELRPHLALAPVTVPSGASAAGLADVALGLERAAQGADHELVVIAAGDLAATLDVTSPGHAVDGADIWDAEVVAAVMERDVAALGAHGPEEAARVQARGWAPITVALDLAVANELPMSTTRYHAPRGVGQLVAY